MSQKITLPLLFLFLCIGTFSQTISYGYDAAGNRISRVILLPTMRSAQARNDVAPEAPVPQQEQLGELDITIYPNPTQGLLQVDIAGMSEGTTAALQVMDMSGTVLESRTSTGSTEINLSDRPAGNYLLVIVCGEKRTSWKVIKQ